MQNWSYYIRQITILSVTRSGVPDVKPKSQSNRIANALPKPHEDGY